MDLFLFTRHKNTERNLSFEPEAYSMKPGIILRERKIPLPIRHELRMNIDQMRGH